MVIAYLASDFSQSIMGELSDFNRLRSVRDIHGVVVVDEQAKVVIKLFNRRMSCPNISRRLGRIDIRLVCSLDCTVKVEQSIALAEL